METKTRKKILLAEDDPSIRSLYSEELRRYNYEIIEAVDGEQAIQLISEVKPDLVLLDIMMPKKSGLDVLAAIMRDPKLNKIPVFILSILDDADDKARGLSLGAIRYIAKAEVIPGQVIQEINNYLAE